MVHLSSVLGSDIGYILHSLRKNKTVHGLDILAGSSPYSDSLVNPIMLTFSLMYMVGRDFDAFRLMFDISGTSAALPMATTKIWEQDYQTGEWMSRPSLSIGFISGVMTLPLGVHLFFKNGAYLSLRHEYMVNQQVGYFYNIVFTVGWVMGGGKQKT